MSEAKNDSKGKRVNCAENGLIAEQYTQNGWFVKIKPIFSLDKKNEFAYNRPTVLFSFVEKGKNGSGFDVYVDMDVFDLWADDVLDRTFKKTLEAESQAGEKYPVTYKYVTGSNGEKTVGFCKSTAKGAFATVNGSTVKDGKKIFANVPVDYNWLRICMKWYRRVTAPYFAMMADVTRKNLVSEWYKPQKEDTEEFTSAPVQESVPVTTETPQKATKQQEREIASSVTPKAENKANTKPYAAYQSIEVVTSTLVQPYGKNGNFCFKAFTKNNKELIFIVMPSEVDSDNISVWEAFRKKALTATNLKTTLKFITVNNKNLVKRVG